MAVTDQVPDREEKLRLVLTREEADAVIARCKEVVSFYLLALSKCIQEYEQRLAPSSSTPSGMIPPYKKPPGRKRRRKPGRKPGHAGTRRGRRPRSTGRRTIS